MTKPSNSTSAFLTSRQVMDRYGGISQMTLWRWLQDDDLSFPKPLRIQRYRYWRLADILAWEDQQLVQDEVIHDQ